MPVHKLHASFNAGELSPLMDSRVNVEKYDAGCRKLRNFILHTHGPVFRRPGLEYLGEVADPRIVSRFIEFNFSVSTTFVIEMTLGQFRFWSNGKLVRKVVDGKLQDVTAWHPYAASEFFEVQVKQVNDVCYLAHRNHPPLKLVRVADDQWTCEQVPFRYPPLLDEFVEKETVATPTVTELYDTALEEAPEFTLMPRTFPVVPTFTVAARAPGTTSTPNPWFTLDWIGWPAAPTGVAGKCVTVQVQKSTGEWVPVTGLEAPIPQTTVGPVAHEYRFKATSPGSASLVVEKRDVTTSTWVAVTLNNFFEASTSTAPDLTFRLDYGPALVNDLPLHKVRVTAGDPGGATGPLMEAPYDGAQALTHFTLTPRTLATIPSFTVPARPAGTTGTPNPWFSLGWTWPTAPTGLAGKTLVLEVQKSTGEWAAVTGAAGVVISTTGTAPDLQEFRFKATSPASPTLVIEKRTGSGTTWAASTIAGFFAGTTASAPDLTFRLVYGPALVNDMPGHKVTVTPAVSASGPLMAAPYLGELPLTHYLQTPTSEEITADWTLPKFVPGGCILAWHIINSGNNWSYLWHWGPTTIPLLATLNGTSGTFRVRSILSGGVTYAFLEHKHAAGYWQIYGSGVPITQAVVCNVTLDIPTITLASTAGRIVGEAVTGPGIPAGARIIAINSATQLTLSANAISTNPGVYLVFARPLPWNMRLMFGPDSGQGVGTQVVTCNIASGSAVVTLAGSHPTLLRSVGELVSGPGIPVGTTIAAIASSPDTQLTLSAAATATNPAVNLTFTDDGYLRLTATDLSHTMKLERQESGPGADGAKSGITVPAGDWRARVTVPPGTAVPPGATVTLQKWVPSGTTGSWAPIITWTLAAGVTNEYVGQLTGAFTTVTLVRLLYKGGGSLRRTAGEGMIDKVEFPPSKAVTLEVSSTIGAGTMLAKDTSTPPQPVELFNEKHVGSFWQIAHRRELSFTQLGGTGSSTPIRVAGRWDLFTYGTWSGTLHLERRGASNIWQVVRSWTSASDRNVVATGNEEQDVDMRLRAVITAAVDTPRFVLEAADSRSYGLVKVTGFTNKSEVTVEVVRTLAATTATSLWAEGAWSEVRGFPAAVGMHEARLWFGGSRHQPQTLWASVSSDFENFRRSTLDDGSLALTLAAESSNSIRWLSSTTALLIGTGGEEWAMRSGADGAPITPTNVRAERQSGYSSMQLGAKMAHEVTIFVQRDGRRVRQLSYMDAQQSFTAGDLTVLAPHVTGRGVRQLAFQQAPTAVLWVVTEDHKLAGMTFEREQNVFGWHVHETDGEIETVAVLHGTPADEVWVGVKRTVVIRKMESCIIDKDSTLVVLASTAERKAGERVAGAGIPEGTVIVSVNNATEITLSNPAAITDVKASLDFSSEETRRYVERMQPQAMAADWSEPRTLVYADSAKVYQFETPQATLTGLGHLEGRECVILLDGMVHRKMTVRDGALALDAPGSHVVVGLPYTSELQPMKQEVQMQDGTAQGRRFKLHGVTVRMDHSLGGEVIADASDATLPWVRMPNMLVMGQAAPLFTGERDVILESRHEAAVNLTVRQREPLPLNITGLILRFDVYDH